MASGSRRGFGKLRKLPSKKWQASYVGPDLQRHTAPATFSAKVDAEGWLSAERRLIERDEWTAPGVRKKPRKRLTLADLWETWPERRERPLKPSTLRVYRSHWGKHIEPVLGSLALAEITPDAVVAWYRGLDTGPTARARTYGLLHALLATAVDDDLIPANPAKIRGASHARRVKDIRPATLEELAIIVGHLEEPKFRALVTFAAWLALRHGEVIELRRQDVDLEAGVVHVRRAALFLEGAWLVDLPKAGSVRSVALPPHLVPVLAAHLAIIGPEPDALLFASQRDAGRHLHADTLTPAFRAACRAAGRPDLTLHGLRHTGAMIAARSGATLPELMERLGHSTPQAAMRYQNAARGRQGEIAEAMSRMAH